MIIQHNIMALNSYNKLSKNNSSVEKNLEKLSSGYRINRAGDDAAGLAISEKMRAQLTGLERAKSNAQDGISLVQTAEGALTEVHSMLNRLVELGTESANGIYQADDRNKIQDEVDQITEEINRISEATNFNGIQLLDGSLGATGVKDVAVDVKYDKLSAYANTLTLNAATKTTIAIQALRPLNTSEWGTNEGLTQTLVFKYEENGKNGSELAVTFKMASTANDTYQNMLLALRDSPLGKDYNFRTLGVNQTFEMQAKNAGKDKFKVHQILQYNTDGTRAVPGNGVGFLNTPGADAFYTLNTGAGALGGGVAYNGDASQNANDFIFEINGEKFAFVTSAGATALTDKSVHTVQVGAAGTAPSTTAGGEVEQMAKLIREKTGINAQQDGANARINLKEGVQAGIGTGGLTLQIGDTSESFNKVFVSVDDMSADGLGIGNLDVSEQGISSKSIDNVKLAIEKVSTNRGRLGALQNRLEHTIGNLATTTENLTSAESRIRDTDMAKEMMQFTKNNVLVQAAQSMLSQANQQPQQVLQLLR